MREHWSTTPLIQHGTVDRFSVLTQQPELGSLEGLLRAHRGNISAYFEDEEGNLKARNVSGAEGLNAVQEGQRLLVHHVAAWSRPVKTFIDHLVHDLGLPPHTVRTIMFDTYPFK